ncbi:MAG: ATP-dependent helicase [Lachnospiraceae bacterium]|nr:ATP-dependent helicase [Lachnospiraceae bacterium]
MDKTLNASQQRAVAHLSGPMQVLAGPGSGKTTVIINRIRHLVTVHGIPASSILVVTFSKAAAREMKERFRTKGDSYARQVTFGTFHSIFFGILKHAYGLRGDQILREEARREFLMQLIGKYAPDLSDDKDFQEDISREISLVKGSGISPENYHSTGCPDQAFQNIFHGYVNRCRLERLLDFDDMLVYCHDLLKQREDIRRGWQQRFPYVLVDEFQDINTIQYQTIRMLAGYEDNLFIVGDDDQSIYHFRGARPELMLNFKKDYPKAGQVLLDVNYRCSGQILQASQNMIQHNRFRFRKKITTPNPPGDPVRILEFDNPRQQALYVLKGIQKMREDGSDPRQAAVLFRTRQEVGALAELLVEYQIPFYMRDRLPNLYEHWIARNFIAYIRLAMGPMRRQDFLKVMNRPNRYISREAVYEKEVRMETLRTFYDDREWMWDRIDELEGHLKRMKSMPPYGAVNYIRHAVGYEGYLKEYAQIRGLDYQDLKEMADRIQESAMEYETFDQWQAHMEDYTIRLQEQAARMEQKPQGVTLSTLHSVKGLEYDKVWILNVNEGTIPYKKAKLEAEIEEERRLFYVGMTRSRKELTLCHVRRQFEKEMERSHFLDEVIVKQ